MSPTFELFGLAACVLAAAIYWTFMPLRSPKPAGKHRIQPDSPSNATAEWWDPTNHHAPKTPFMPFEAHAVMQQHRKCSASHCARKAAAFDTLTGSGAIKPRTRCTR